MKIRRPFLIKTLSLMSSVALRGWLSTLNIRYRPLGPNCDPCRREVGQRYIYAFWHEYLILLCHYARRDVQVLISLHADGELIAQVCRLMGMSVVRGSTTRGGVDALWQMLRLSKTCHLAITPDGPRGPRRTVQPGVVYLAARTGLPIVPIGVSYPHCWRAASWDRFGAPYPFSTGYGVTAEPIRVPADADRSTLEAYRLRVENELIRVNELADRWGHTGSWPYAATRQSGTKAVA